MNPWGLQNRVACIEKPHTMHGAGHSACFRRIHQQSRCKRPQQVLWSRWVWSAIWTERKLRQWEELKTSKRWQWIDCTDTGSSKWVHWHAIIQSTNPSNTNYGCDNTMEFDTGVAWGSLLITRNHLWVAQKSKIEWLLATNHIAGWIDPCQVCDGCFQAILILHPVDVEKANNYSASHHECVQWHVWSDGWSYASCS